LQDETEETEARDDVGAAAAPFLAPVDSDAGSVDIGAIDRFLSSTSQADRAQLHRLLAMLIVRIRAHIVSTLSVGLLPEPHAAPRNTNSKRFVAISSRILSRGTAEGRTAEDLNALAVLASMCHHMPSPVVAEALLEDAFTAFQALHRECQSAVVATRRAQLIAAEQSLVGWQVSTRCCLLHSCVHVCLIPCCCCCNASSLKNV
jgi:hypothetical protein